VVGAIKLNCGWKICWSMGRISRSSLPSGSFILSSRLPLRLLDDLLFFRASIIACCLSDRLPCFRHLLICPPSLVASSPAASPIDSQPPSPANPRSLAASPSSISYPQLQGYTIERWMQIAAESSGTWSLLFLLHLYMPWMICGGRGIATNIPAHMRK
jgi:hypothetical protein